MADITDEELMQFADHTLNGEDAARVADALARDPSLHARLAVFTQTGHVLREPFSDIVNAPVPSRLVDAIMTAGRRAPTHIETRTHAKSAVFEGARGLLDALFSFGRPRYAPAFAAALLAVGAMAGWQLHRMALLPAAGNAPIVVVNGQIRADGLLATALETARSGETVKAVTGDGSASVRFTFKSRAHGYCRQYEFDARPGAKSAGIACRTPDGQWQIQFHAPTVVGGGSTTGVVPVGDAKAQIAAIVTAISVGDPLDLEEEAIARAGRWR